jgi:Cof subfamily protein (haloacid dehalogenase superfamily)
MIQKLVFLDVDGTLLAANGLIPPSASDACREARRQGHLLYLCTGRAMVELSRDILSVGFDGIISSGGAHVETGETSVKPYTGTVIFDTVIQAELVKKIAAYLCSRQCGFSLEKNHVITPNFRFLSHWKSVTKHMDGINTEEIFSELIRMAAENPLPEIPEESHYEGVNKIIFIQSGFLKRRITFAGVKCRFGKVCELFHGSFPYCGGIGGEIGPRGIHKGSSAQKVALYHCIPLANTIAFGDSDNDRPMFECTGTGIAMGNACDKLKKIAGDITNTPEGNGIYNGFKKLGLI